MSLLRSLSDTKSIIIIVAASLIFFDINYFVMSRLPGYRDNMCLAGGEVTLANILFTIVLSLMFGIFLAGFIKSVKVLRGSGVVQSSFVGTSGFILGNFTLFCPLCIFPAISLFSLSVSLSFFTTYNWLIKLLSLGLMSFALIMLNKKFKASTCSFCKI